ncbi:MAG: acyltransferase [Betaproteobacteria bacterium]|nr:acyltransferase [Betaproteobacteria bacterium]
MTALISACLFLLLLKPLFNICAYVVSFIYIRLINNRVTSFQKVYPPTDLSKPGLRKLIGRYVSGLVYYATLQTGKISFHFIRNFIYKYVFRMKMMKGAIIYGGVEIRRPDKLTVGKGSVVGHDCILDARNMIEIGENVNIGNGVWLWSTQHNHRSQKFDNKFSKVMKIVVHDRVWLGPRVTVLPGCIIGEGAVIGAGSVVTKDIEPFTINAGIPAKKVGERSRDIDYVLNGRPLPFI